MLDTQVIEVVSLLDDLDGYGLIVVDTETVREVLAEMDSSTGSLEDMMSLLTDLDGDGIILADDAQVSDRLRELGYEREYDEVYEEDTLCL